MAALKRFILFGGDEYYPRGGGEEFLGSFDSLEDAVGHVRVLVGESREPFDSGDMSRKWAKAWDTHRNTNYAIYDDYTTEELSDA